MSGYLFASLILFAAALAFAAMVNSWREGIRTLRPIGELGLASPSVTVIVPARNEEENIVAVLQDLYAQSYPRELMQVLVVDDHSTDRTASIVQGMMRNWPQLQLLKNGGEGKKAAITTAVDKATNELIVLTDADVRCASQRIATIMAHWKTDQSDLIILPVWTEGSGLVGGVQEDEQAALLAVALGTGQNGSPALAYGANLAFTKRVFESVGGYSGDRFASGDDVFLLQRMKRSGKRIAVCGDPRTCVTASAQPTLKQALVQRLRWAGKMRGVTSASNILGLLALLYPWSLFALSIGFSVASNMGHRALYTAGLLVASWLLWSIPLLKMVSDLRATMQREPQRLRALFSLITFSIYAPIVAVTSMVLRPEWKGRRIR